MIDTELGEKREEMCLSSAQLADKPGVDLGQYVSWEGDLDARGDDVRRLLTLAVEKIEMDLRQEQSKPEIEAKLAEPEAVLARGQE